MPKLVHTQKNLLLCVDDRVILTSISLKRALRLLIHYCIDDKLLIQYFKSKAEKMELQWESAEPVMIFKYLEIIFPASGSRNTHLDLIMHRDLLQLFKLIILPEEHSLSLLQLRYLELKLQHNYKEFETISFQWKRHHFIYFTFKVF